MLVEAESSGTELFERDETIDYADIRHVLGEAIDGSTEAFHASLRDSHASQKMVTQ